MVRVKVCGITRPEDALAAAEAGADAIGLVFYSPSPRAVDSDSARAIIECLPPFITSVGLFVDAAPEYVREVLSKVPLDLLQFHGDETDAYCQLFSRPYMKALRVRSGDDLNALAARWPGACGILLDSFKQGVPGGTGEVFDWSMIPVNRTWNLILAGGLDADNVAGAVALCQPWAVDVSGGVEKSKGIKDAAKITRFVHEVKA